MIRFCTLYSSSSGNSVFISDGRTNLLVDAGVSASKIVNALGDIGNIRIILPGWESLQGSTTFPYMPMKKQ